MYKQLPERVRQRVQALADQLSMPVEVLVALALKYGLADIERAARRFPAPPSGDEPGEEVRP